MRSIVQRLVQLQCPEDPRTIREPLFWTPCRGVVCLFDPLATFNGFVLTVAPNMEVSPQSGVEICFRPNGRIARAMRGRDEITEAQAEKFLADLFYPQPQEERAL